MFFSSRDSHARDVKIRGSMGGSNHEKVEFKTLCGKSKAKSRIGTLDFQRATSNFSFTYLEVSHGLECLKVRGPRKAEQHLNSTSPNSRLVHT